MDREAISNIVNDCMIEAFNQSQAIYIAKGHPIDGGLDMQQALRFDEIQEQLTDLIVAQISYQIVED